MSEDCIWSLILTFYNIIVSRHFEYMHTCCSPMMEVNFTVYLLCK